MLTAWKLSSSVKNSIDKASFTCGEDSSKRLNETQEKEEKIKIAHFNSFFLSFS